MRFYPRDANLRAAANQQNQEAGTADRLVTSALQHFHPSAVKGWCMADVSGNAVASYNVSSVTDGGTGDATINWDTDFSSANYCAVGSAVSSSQLYETLSVPVAGSVQIQVADSGASLTDPTNYMVVAFGDQ